MSEIVYGCGLCCGEAEEYIPPKVSLLTRLKQRLVLALTGPPGPAGPMGPKGDTGRDGHLQVSGLPSGTRIALYNDAGAILWSGQLTNHQAGESK